MIRRILAAAVAVAIIAAGVALYTPDADQNTLRARYLASPGDLRTIEGTSLHVRDTGPRDAPALILLHGFGSSLHTWEPWARALDSTYRVIRFDLPGSGLSAPDPTGDYADMRSMQLLATLMDTLGLRRATLIGNSMGGRIAWSFAARYPERVEKLVLISPDGFASPGFEYGKPAEVPFALSMMRYVMPMPLLRMSLEPAYADRRTMTDSLATRYYDLMLAPGARDAMLQRMRQTILTDPVPQLQKIQAPTLLLWGQQDAMIPFSNAADYTKALPHATLVPLPNVGHLPFEESPDASLVPLLRFLRGAN
ncbi:alpha/beta fold hydrolase [Gemmatimonas groenlandica]|uniref:Alpha/beta hydrolase n=1 Tax=Gemmatimonas groenlandica TaxID=2732249 RepID=A0A6M4IP11_9BACT|nr:alpha/beta hydrolase [Gemmatimonas groenlandica]QJR35765.1 alpha/beta hydrolase [Gemmatimonas groenlandica]